MAEVNDSRFCPICSQIVPREQQGVKIKVSPSRTILLHEGCGKIVYDAYEAEMTDKESEIEE